MDYALNHCFSVVEAHKYTEILSFYGSCVRDCPISL